MTSIIETIPGTKAVEIIFFFGAENPLSNWHPAQFVVRDVTFRNAEQFMMYCKAKLFADEETALRIIEAKSPRDHKTLGRSVRGFDEVTWKAKCQHYVFNGCLAKFQQNPEIADFLLRTGESELVEASPYDRIWGVGLSADNPLIQDKKNWLGQNLLGQVLMQVRDALRGISVDGTIVNPEARQQLVYRLWAKQEPLLRCLYDAGDEAVKREAQIAYDASVLDHEQMLGRTAMCHEVDRDLWGAFSDLYKERNLYRPRVPETVAYVQQWFIDDKRKYPESYVGQQPT